MAIQHGNQIRNFQPRLEQNNLSPQQQKALQNPTSNLSIQRDFRVSQPTLNRLESTYGKAAVNFAKTKLVKLDRQGAAIQNPGQFLKANAKAARDAAMGRTDSSMDLGATVGKSKYEKGGKVGQNQTYITIKQKDVGRDPGQIAKLNPFNEDRYKDMPINLLRGANTGDRQSVQILVRHMDKLVEDSEDNPQLSDKINTAKQNASEKHGRPNKAQVMREYYTQLPKPEKMKFLEAAAFKEIAANNPKYAETHMIKGDYAETDKGWFKGTKVQISDDLAHGKFPKAKEKLSWSINPLKWGNDFKILGARFSAWKMKFGGSDSKQGANEGMVREAIATDVMRQLGRAGGGDSNYVTQEIRLVKAQWDNGDPKLMLDIKFIDKSQTEQEFGTQLPQGSQYQDFEGNIVEGRLVDKQWDPATGDYVDTTGDIEISKQSGKPKEPIDVPKDSNGKALFPAYKEGSNVGQLGRAKMKMLLLGDRDALGGTGANKGSVGNYMAAIDPGHSFEHHRMKHDISDDFSFKQPTKWFLPEYQTKFKHFEVFDKAPLSEKMRGVQDIQKLHNDGIDEAIFDQYLEDFDGSKDEQLNFADKINQWKADYHAKKEFILGKDDGTPPPGVFEQRLKVYDFTTNGVPNGPKLNDGQQDAVFDVMDGLEKITSKSDWRSPNGLVELERPRVETRVPWQVEQNDDGTLTFTAPHSDEAFDRLLAFTADLPDEFTDAWKQTQTNDGKDVLQLTIRPDQLASFSNHLSNDNVKEAVKDRVSPDVDQQIASAQQEAQLKLATAKLESDTNQLTTELGQALRGDDADTSHWSMTKQEDGSVTFSSTDVDRAALGLVLGARVVIEEQDDGYAFTLPQDQISGALAWLQRQQQGL